MKAVNAEARGGFRFPLFQGLLPIKGAQVPTEIIAGITLAALAIPEVMGYTKIAGVPVITGLYTILIPMALFAFIGSSRHLVVGADSATAAILAAGLTGLAATGSAEYVALCGLLALLAAGFLILARIVRLGFLADFLSRTVLVGFLTGVGIQVALGEISGMLGIKGGGHGPIQQVMGDLKHVGETHLYTLIVAATVLLIIVGSKRISNKIPGALIAVIGAIAVSWALDLHALGVAVLGKVPGGLPYLGLPKVDWSWALVGKLLPTAFSIFILVLAQSAATSRAYAARYKERFSENLDLVGLGLANLGAGLSGTFPVNGSPTKTEMVDSAGGRTQLSQITTVVIVLLVLLFLTGPLAYMPEAVLSAVVFLIGLALIDIKGMQQIYHEARSEFWVALITTVVVVFVGVEQGILLAMVLSLLDHVRHGYRPKNMLIVPNQAHGWRTAPLSTPSEFEPGLLVYRFSHSLYYANAEAFSEEVNELIRDPQPPLNWFCIVADAIDDVDFSAAETLRSIVGSLKEKGIRLVFVMVSDEVKAEFDRYGITDLVGEDAFYTTGDHVFSAYSQRKK
jgi:high affinity sulfate transporter 1